MSGRRQALRSGGKTQEEEDSKSMEEQSKEAGAIQPEKATQVVKQKEKGKQETEQSLTMSKTEFDQMRSDQMALLTKFDQMLSKMTNMDAKIGQTSCDMQQLNKKVGQIDSKVQQTSDELNTLQRCLETKVKQEVMETTREIVEDLEKEITEKQEALQYKLEGEWSSKLDEIHRLCEQKNEQHVKYLQEQTKTTRENIEKKMQDHDEEMIRVVHNMEEQRAEIRKLKENQPSASKMGSQNESDADTDDFPTHDVYPQRGRARHRTRPDRQQRMHDRQQQKTNVSKIIATLPQFRGKQGTWESFISTFNAVTQKLEIDDNDRLDFLMISFRDEAAEFKDLLPNTVKTNYVEVIRRCEERFGKKEDEITTRRQLAAIKQLVDETEDQFAERIERLVRQAYPSANDDVSNAMAVDAFIKGCSNKRAALMVADQAPQPQNINEAVRKVKAHISNQAAILGDNASKIRRFRQESYSRSPSRRRQQKYDSYNDRRSSYDRYDRMDDRSDGKYGRYSRYERPRYRDNEDNKSSYSRRFSPRSDRQRLSSRYDTDRQRFSSKYDYYDDSSSDEDVYDDNKRQSSYDRYYQSRRKSPDKYKSYRNDSFERREQSPEHSYRRENTPERYSYRNRYPRMEYDRNRNNDHQSYRYKDRADYDRRYSPQRYDRGRYRSPERKQSSSNRSPNYSPKFEKSKYSNLRSDSLEKYHSQKKNESSGEEPHKDKTVSFQKNA